MTKRFAALLLMLVAVLLVAPAAFAQETGGAAKPVVNWVDITPGFAMAIASAACGYAQAKATMSACEGLARNPGAAAHIRFAFILALVLIESMALYTFAIIYLKYLR